MRKIIKSVVLALLAITLAACDSKSTDSGATAFISKGPVTGATCNIYKVAGGVKDGVSLATATSSAGTVDFGDLAYTGIALISCTGGTYTDEATGNTLNAPVMNSVVTVSTGGHYVMSPLTELAFRLAGADLQTVIDTHNAAVATQFGLGGIDITSEQPTDLNTAAAGNDNAGKYGSVLAGISQLQNNGTEGADLDAVLTSLATDLADGTLDTSTQNNMADAVDDLGNSAVAGQVNTDATDAIVGNVLVAPVLGDASNQTYTYDSAISTLIFANTGGKVLTACSANPVLPAGLNVAVGGAIAARATSSSANKDSCVISGTPSAAQAATDYIITATNAAGTDTADVSIVVSPLAITVTAVAVNKVYGATNPTFTHDSNGLGDSETLVGTLTSAGTDVGTHDVTGTLTNANYTVTLVGTNKFTITSKPITVTATAVSKVYGATNPAFTHDGNGLVNGDTLGGTLISAGSVVGTHDVTGTLINANYAVTLVGTDKFTITSKPITLTATAVSKVYGATNPAFTHDSNGLINGDTLVGALTSAGSNVGTHDVTGTLTNANYAVTMAGKDKFTITTKPLAVTANALSKAHGESDPFFTYTTDVSLIGQDTFTGAIGRDTGSDVGTYNITQDSFAAGSNYNISYTGATFTIRPLPPTNLVVNPTNGVGAKGNKLAFSWSAPASGGANNYNVYSAGSSMSASVNSDVSSLSPFNPAVTNTGTAVTQGLSDQLADGTYHFLVTTKKNGIESFTSATNVSAVPSTNSILADPYIIGATLYQDTNGDGSFTTGEPVSSVTDTSGSFTFSEVLTAGKSILIKTQGQHEGVTYDVDLEAIVATGGKVDVVTPLTTFTSKGLSNQDLADILNFAATNGQNITVGNPAVAWSITANDVALNPLSGDLLNVSLADLQADEGKLIKLHASLSTYALLKIFEGSTTLKGLTGATLHSSGTTANGAVALLAKNVIASVTDSLDSTLLASIDTQIGTLRTALTQGGVPNVTTLAPTANTDLISKVAVTAIDRLAEVGYEACNSEGGDVSAKVTAALTAMGTNENAVTSKIMQLATKLYGMKHAATLGNAQITGGLGQAQAGGNADAGYLLDGINAAGAGNVTFRYNNSNVITAQ